MILTLLIDFVILCCALSFMIFIIAYLAQVDVPQPGDERDMEDTNPYD